jgi:shikimate dehydrogenase
MISLALTGFPLTHSLSPVLHRAALAAAHLPGDYTLLPAALPKDLTDILNRLRAGTLHGLNVTIPHKQSILPLLDALTDTARAIGAVNTVYVRDGQLIGDNTDAPGFLSDFQSWQSAPSADNPILILGAGGAARAVAYALSRHGYTLHIAARRLDQARTLATDFALAGAHPLAHSSSSPCSVCTLSLSIIINTTPLGMSPDTQATPWAHPFPANAAVYDLIYNPRETTFLQQARTARLPTRNGLGMLIEQAALAFEIWTGAPANREAMRTALHIS